MENIKTPTSSLNGYEFDGVNWVIYKPKEDHDYLVGYKGFSFIEPFYPAQIYCPYIPQYYDEKKN